MEKNSSAQMTQRKLPVTVLAVLVVMDSCWLNVLFLSISGSGETSSLCHCAQAKIFYHARVKILLTTTSFQDTPGAHHDLLASTGWEIIRASGPLNEAETLAFVGEVDATSAAMTPSRAKFWKRRGRN